MRSYFVLAQNGGPPGRFEWNAAACSPLLVINELWDETNKIAGSLLIMRVRSESPVGERMTDKDRIESVIGLIDSTTRWRMAATVVRISIQSIRTPSIAQACFAALGALVSKHQASFTIQEKQAIAASIQNEIAKVAEEKTRQAIYEREVAQMFLRFIFADNEYEAAGMMPYLTMYMINRGADDEDGNVRALTIGTLYSAMMLGEAANRLSERIPEWFYAPMPETGAVPAHAPASAAKTPESSVHDNNDEEDAAA